MLTQLNIDALMEQIQESGRATIYYVANMIETREGILDEHIFKSNPKFKVMEILVTDIHNAYFDYMDYKENCQGYHTEEESYYLDPHTKHSEYFIVKNSETYGTFNNDINPRTPSIIFGKRKSIIDNISSEIKFIDDPSPVKPIYVNRLYYGSTCYEIFRTDDSVDISVPVNFQWKYKKLSVPVNNNGINYYFVTSNWYVLDTPYFPKVEKPLINVKEKCAYFMTIEDAFNYIEQIEA